MRNRDPSTPDRQADAVSPGPTAFRRNGVTAHRGNAVAFPENTLPAFENALSLGVDWIELDIHRTRDGHLVVIHDADTRRVGDRSLTISASTLAELRSVDVAHGFRERGGFSLRECPPARIPLLAEVLSLVMRQARIRLSIQPKADCVDEALALIAGMRAEKWVGFNDGDLAKMKAVKTYSASIPVFWDRPADADVDADVAIARAEGFEAMVIQHTGINEAKVEKIHASGLEAGAWTVNDPARMKTLLAMGVERLYTDDPQLLLELSV